MRLGGFHRLWIVLSFLYFMIIALFIINTWPNAHDIPNKIKFYNALAPDIKKLVHNPFYDKYGGIPVNSTPVEMPNKYVIYFEKSVPKETIEKASVAYWVQVEKEATHQQINLLLLGLLYWLIPCATVYVAGLLIQWIIRGFKERDF